MMEFKPLVLYKFPNTTQLAKKEVRLYGPLNPSNKGRELLKKRNYEAISLLYVPLSFPFCF